MEGAQENNKNPVVPLCMNDLSKDLVHGLSNQTNPPNEKQKNVLVSEEEEENGELQLSLGSMNNKFGVEPKAKKLRRWSSVLNSGLTSATVENVLSRCHVPLMGSFSMPAEVEEECRRRKAVESMEARKKRMEKMKAVRFANEGVGIDDGNGGVGVRNCGGGISIGAENVNVLSPSSYELHRSGSVGFTELLRQQIEAAAMQNPEVRSPFVHPSPALPQVEHVHIIRTADMNAEDANDVVRTELPDMPYVTTRGPKGNKIEGFLYKYLKEDDIKIVCVCHGTFLSPAEFIKHAGGGDVEYPLRHITVTRSPLFQL